MEKSLYRTKFAEVRKNLDSGFMREAAEAFRSLFMASVFGSGCTEKTIMVYSSFGNEAGTLPLIEGLCAAGAKVVLPKVEGADILPYYYFGPSSMKAGPFGIMEPDPEKCRPCAPASIDVIVVPGLAFDENGGRLGFGKGYYDRFLPLLREDAVKIGLCYSVQVLTGEALPTESHDIAMDFLLTEKGFFNCKTRSYTGL